MNVEKAKLVLSSCCSAKYVNWANTSFGWDSVNMRTILGDMYDKYDTFNLSLCSISTTSAPTDCVYGGVSQGNYDGLYVLMNMSGLSFKNQTYNVKTGNMCPSIVLLPFTLPALKNTSTKNNYTGYIYTFEKSQDLCNINIWYSRISDGFAVGGIINGGSTYFPSAVPYPYTVFTFDIVGVEKTKKLRI